MKTFNVFAGIRRRRFMKEPIHILIVEDDPFIQTILHQNLSRQYRLTTFSNGMDALSFLQNGNIPDFIISDLNVPRLDGLQLIEQVKNSGFFSAIPIIILSGEQRTEKKIQCLEAGADDYVEKPFNPREIEVRIKTILKRLGRVEHIRPGI